MNILLIEDDQDDIELLEDALKSYSVTCQLEVLKDGNQAVAYVRNSSGSHDIIILDFNLPKVHGREVLVTIKSSPALQQIPLLILTTSSSREDIDFAYKNGADKYLIKPTTMEEIKKTVETIVELSQKTQSG